jgi:glycosyltransferase involved in cell wall biosynthesis
LYFLTYIAQLLAGKSGGKYDLTLNTFGDIINSIADLTYVHFPLRAAVSYSQIPAFSNRSMWQTVSPIYDAVTGTMDKICPGNLLTNSKFMQKIIQDVLRRKSIVVYPPVGVETFSRCYRPRKNGCLVAVVASYTPKRHLDQVPVIAKNSRFAKFVVMGKADEYSLPTLKRLKYLVKDLHVENKIRFLTNVPFSELAHMLSDAKLYLHVMHNDHFGISVVEAMASGCVPIVHRSGGPWLDILDSQQGAYGYSYSNAEEAASIIDTLITDEDLRSKIASRASYRAKRFDRSVFMNKMVEVVEQIAS